MNAMATTTRHNELMTDIDKKYTIFDKKCTIFDKKCTKGGIRQEMHN